MADIDENDPAFSRLDNRDIRDTVMLSADEHNWSKARAEELDLSHSSYIRSLIIADRRSVEMTRLSHGERRKNTADPAQVLRNLAKMLGDFQ